MKTNYLMILLCILTLCSLLNVFFFYQKWDKQKYRINVLDDILLRWRKARLILNSIWFLCLLIFYITNYLYYKASIHLGSVTHFLVGILLVIIFITALILQILNNKRHLKTVFAVKRNYRIIQGILLVCLVGVATYPTKSSYPQLNRTEYSSMLYEVVKCNYVVDDKDVLYTTIYFLYYDYKVSHKKVLGVHESNAYYVNTYGYELSESEYKALREKFDEDTIYTMTPDMLKLLK